MTGTPAIDSAEVAATRRTRAAYERRASSFDAMAWGWEKFLAGRIRRNLWSGVEGRVLELGVGTGVNLAYYGPNTRVTAVDLSIRMLGRTRSKSEKGNVAVELSLADASHLPFARNAFDAAVATFVLCSVTDPARAVRELCRVVRPGGKILLAEQVRVDAPLIGTAMDLLDPLILPPSGAHVARRTAEIVEACGARLVRNQPYGPFGFVRLLIATV